jgi:hypothetical protein
MSSQETKLWCAVITQAITDATMPLDAKTTRERVERQLARDWFINDDRNFRAVCHQAGLEPDRVRSYVLPLIEEAAKHDVEMPDRPLVKRGRPTQPHHTNRTSA